LKGELDMKNDSLSNSHPLPVSQSGVADDSRLDASRINSGIVSRQTFLKGVAAVSAGSLIARPLRAGAAAQPFAGQTITVAVGSFMSEGIKYAVDSWQKMTGATVQVAEIPVGDLYDKLNASFTANTAPYDAIVFAAVWAPEFAAAGHISQLDQYYSQETGWDTVLPAIKREMYVKGKRYTVPLDGDVLMGYYRTDAFADPDAQSAFKSEFKYALKPPETWTEFKDIAKFFTGRTWGGSRKSGFGVLECMKPHDLTAWYVLNRSACYSAFPGKPGSFYFDKATMKPHVNNPGFVRGLTEFIEMRKYGPDSMLTYGGGDLRGNYVSGEYALANDWGDIGVLAQDETRSTVKGKLGYYLTPGTYDVYDNDARRWVHFSSVQHAPFMGWGGWQGAVTKKSHAQAAAFSFLAYLDSPANSLYGVTLPATARNPYHSDQFAPAKWTNALIRYKDPEPYLSAIKASLQHPNAQPDLRIPQTGRYYQVLDRYVQQALVGSMTPKATLDAVAAEWEHITDQAGRSQQRDYYLSMYGLKG